jgi:hypothetical protein
MLSTILIRLLALAVALGMIAWAAEKRSNDAQSQIALYVQHPNRLLIAVALLLAPWLLSTVVWMFIGSKVYQPGGGEMPMILAVSAVLSIFGGLMLGLSTSCLLEPPRQDAPPRLALAMGVAVAMLLVPVWFFVGAFLTGVVHFVAEAAILVIAYFVSGSGSAKVATAADTSTVVQPAGSPAMALLLAFAPAALLLLVITLSAVELRPRMSEEIARVLFIAACIFSLICCFISSRMLFSRRTTGAVLGAVVLLLLNACIAFAFGCGALLVGMSFH